MAKNTKWPPHVIFCPTYAPIVQMSNPEPRKLMFNPLNFFADLHSYGALEQIQLCCPNLVQFFNLHKSKTDSGRHLDNVTFEPLVLQYCVITLFLVYKVHRIHL